jgi:hypothetical protein
MPIKFTYGRNPARSNRDAVRFFTGDVDRESAFLDDDEIDWSLTDSPNPRMAAAVLLDNLATRFSRKADISVGQVSKTFSGIADALRERAKNLREEASRRSALPFFGGLTISGKNDLDERTDDVQPHFRLKQFDNPLARQFDDGSVPTGEPENIGGSG